MFLHGQRILCAYIQVENIFVSEFNVSARQQNRQEQQWIKKGQLEENNEMTTKNSELTRLWTAVLVYVMFRFMATTLFFFSFITYDERHTNFGFDIFAHVATTPIIMALFWSIQHPTVNKLWDFGATAPPHRVACQMTFRDAHSWRNNFRYQTHFRVLTASVLPTADWHDVFNNSVNISDYVGWLTS